MKRRTFTLLTATAATFLPRLRAAENPYGAWMDGIRTKHALPGLAGGIITADGLAGHGWCGVRKAGSSVPVESNDLWHLGSMTKAMTATLLGTWVAAGKLRWDATLGDLLPRLVSGAKPEVRGITLRQLLSHRSGFRANLTPWSALPAAGNRPEIVRREAARELEHPPGTQYLYSNLGYMIAGVVAESLGGQLWERLINRRLFTPLKMKAGFGGTGTPGIEDQPWPHSADGTPEPQNGPQTDNPPSLGPAGTCHARLTEYAKFIADQLRGAAGGESLLPTSIYKDLHQASPGADYALGWGLHERQWGGGTVLSHNGTNTMNYAVVWMAPVKGFAVAAFTNQGGDKAAQACDEVCSRLISEHTRE